MMTSKAIEDVDNHFDYEFEKTGRSQGGGRASGRVKWEEARIVDSCWLANYLYTHIYISCTGCPTSPRCVIRCVP